jgi:preprotein translocase subunit YajC
MMPSISSFSAALASHHGTLLADGAAGSSLSGLLPIILMFAVIYFIVLRPMSKQEKDRKKRVEGLKKGDQVVLQGGILGRISNADDPKIAVVELADRVRVRVLKSKIEDLQDSVLKDDKDASKKDEKAASKKDDKDEKADKAVEKADKAADKAKESSEPDNDKDARKGA